MPRETLIARLQDLQRERAELLRNYSRPPGQLQYTTGDNEASFGYAENYAYYERLTGHIEEVRYLMAAVGAH